MFTVSQIEAARQALASAMINRYGGITSFGTATYGPAQRFTRQRILTALYGRKARMSECGWTAFRRTLIAVAGIVPTCGADGDDKLSEWARPGYAAYRAAYTQSLRARYESATESAVR